MKKIDAKTKPFMKFRLFKSMSITIVSTELDVNQGPPNMNLVQTWTSRIFFGNMGLQCGSSGLIMCSMMLLYLNF